MSIQREQWSSSLRCLAAATSSAIGLGTLWRVPYTIGEHGGGAFFLAYIFCIFVVGIPLFIAEILIGRHTKQSVISAIRIIEKKSSLWEIAGWIGVIASFLILTYYTVLAGWGIGFLALSLMHAHSMIPENSFERLVHNGFASILCHVTFLAISISIIYAGVKKGIERWSLIVTTSLFILLLLFVSYTFFLPGFWEAFWFIFKPDYTKVTSSTFIQALGLSFFTLSLGQGIMVTYGSYMDKRENVPRISVFVSLMVCLVASLSALATFPILFSFHLPSESGIGLVFTTMPILFSKLPFPALFSSLFFLLFVLAALGGSFALTEVVVATLIEIKGWSRKKATIAVGIGLFLFGLPNSLSYILSDWLGGKNYLSLLDSCISDWVLPVGGLLMVLFARNRFPVESAKEQFCSSATLSFFFPFWLFCIRYITPTLLLFILLHKVCGLL